jgi:hypothetical protein
MKSLDNEYIKSTDISSHFNFNQSPSLKRANTSSSSELSSYYFEDLGKGEYALSSQPELNTQTTKKNLFSSPLANDFRRKRRTSCFLKGSKKPKINLKKQIRKSVQRLRNQSESKLKTRFKKLKHLGFEIGNLIMPKMTNKKEEKSEDESDESIKTKKKYLNKQRSQSRRKKPKKLKAKLKIQKQKVNLQLKDKIMRKMKGLGYKKISKSSTFNFKLKSFIYDNAIVNKNPKNLEGIVLYQTGEIYYGKLNSKNKPNGRGVLFSNDGSFLYGDFEMGIMKGKAITNDKKYLKKNVETSPKDSEFYFL